MTTVTSTPAVQGDAPMVGAVRRDVVAQHGPAVARSVRRVTASTLSPTATTDPASDNIRSALQAASVALPERDRVADEQWGYGPAVAVRGGAIDVSGVLVFLEGEGTDAERYAAGLRSAWRCIEPMLGTNGATLDDAIPINSYHTEFARQLEVAVRVHRELTASPHRAWTGVGIVALAAPDDVTESDVTAHRSLLQHLFRRALHTQLEQRRL